MSVYKKAGRQTYSYDFQLRGRRFTGDTGQTSKREAKLYEDEQRQEALALLAREQSFFADTMTFEIAAIRWWEEVGKHHVNIDTTLWSLGWLTDKLGAQTDLRDITDSVVAALVARRRGERKVIRLAKGKTKKGDLIKPATVNRTCTQPLRKIILRAKNVWKVQVGEIDFGKHLLAEPQERVREASRAEEAAILTTANRGYDDAIQFAFLTGCRRMEVLGLEWKNVDFFSRRFTVVGKGDKARTIPMSQAIYDLLWAQKDHHETVVFTYEAEKTQPRYGIIKGHRYPLTREGLKSKMRRTVAKTGIENFRFHDTRHTAATRVLRESNLRVAQRLLGHSDVATTAKYAHALDDDLRDALEATARPKTGENPDRKATKNLK
jgi:integrase